jgi:holo-[acyl-carrier protein] synthase
MRIVGVGTHIVECLRIAQLIERHGELFLNRVFTAAEIQYCSERNAATQHYAARWAAKEATLRALGSGWTRGIGWRDIEVAVGPHESAQLQLYGGVQEIAARQSIDQWKLSLSHCRTHATATVLAMATDAPT